MAHDVKTIIRYDGPALTGHEIDVEELAPALLALASMVQLANRKFNGDSATMRVTVKADVEQACFQLEIHILQSLLENARHLFGTSEYKTAKEIAEILDLILPGGVAGGVIWLWKNLVERQRAIEAGSVTAMVTEQSGGQTTIVYGGGNNITVKTDVYLLATDPDMAELGKKVMKPLEQPGYESLTFHETATGKPVIQVTKEEATAFIRAPLLLASPKSDSEDSDDEAHNDIRVTAFVKTQRNEGRAQWELKWGGKTETVSMDATDWLDQFQAGQVPHDLPLYLDVVIDVVTSKTDPDAPARFHVKRVVGIVPSGQGKQQGLFSHKPT